MVACTVRDSSYPLNASHARRQPISVYVDRNFVDYEKREIKFAFDAWTRASNGIVQFDVHWDVPKPYVFYKHEKPKADQGIFIWQLGLYDRSEVSEKLYNEYHSYHGLFIPGPNDSANILIFTDVVAREHFYQVVVHEIGHLIGLDHEKGHEDAIMYPHATGDCISKWDMKALCSIYGCSPRNQCVNIIPEGYKL